jgi:integrase
MAGQLIERGDRVWLVRIFKGRDADGKRKYLNRTVHGSKKDAQRVLNKLLHQKDTGILVEPSKQTLAEYLNRWLEVAAKPRLRQSTHTDHKYRVDRYILPTLGGTRLSHLTALDIQALYTRMMEPKPEGLGLTPRSVRIVHNILNPALKQAVRWKLIPYNPAADVDLPSEKRQEMKAFSPEQAARFLDAARSFPGDPDVIEAKGHDPRAGRQDRFFALWCVLLAGGLRPSEALGLKWDDLDGDRLRVRRSLTRLKGGGWTLTEPKTVKGKRAVPLPGFALDALKEHRKKQAAERLKAGEAWQAHGFIFAAENGEPLNTRNIDQRHFQKILKAAGLPRMRPYDLRHSHATLLLANGEHPKVVSERLGHASITLTLDTYSHVLPGMQEQATERLDALLTGARQVR